jgi:hypothetical protein
MGNNDQQRTLVTSYYSAHIAATVHLASVTADDDI